MKIRIADKWHTITLRLVSSFVGLVLLTAVAVGVPAIWLIQSQSENQAWAQIEQGSRATQALLTAWQKEVSGLALLTAERPTIPLLLAQENPVELEAFLATLQEGTELDLLLVCNRSQEQVALVGDESLGSLCFWNSTLGYYVADPEVDNRLWLLAAEQIVDQDKLLGLVIVGIALDEVFATQMKEQTGLEHIFVVEDDLLASSFPPTATIPSTILNIQNNEEALARNAFTLNGRPYFTIQLELDSADLTDQVALEVTSITHTQQRLVGTLVGSIILAAVFGSIVGVLLARGLARPLRQLTNAAAAMSKQDLDVAVSVNTEVKEVVMVAQALETARLDLQRILNELRQTNAWNDHLLESIAEGIVVLDENGRITFFSPGAERITGQTQNDVLGKMATDVFHFADTDDLLHHLLPQPGQTYRMTLELADDKQAVLAMTNAQLSLPSIGKAGTALVFRDITANERIHQLLGQFLANITHEFRTPLSALAASTELMMDQAANLTSAELKELLNSLHLGILGLQTLIDNLLEGASLEAGRFRVYPRPTNLDTIIPEAVNTMKPLQEKYDQQIELDLPENLPLVQADPRRIAQVMINLLSNAIKYSPDGSVIRIYVAEVDGFLRIVVVDQGPGVPQGYRPNLFRRLAHPGIESSKAQSGVGLGLSVVKAIVEAHHGKVGVEDNPQGGSMFWFTLPKGAAE